MSVTALAKRVSMPEEALLALGCESVEGGTKIPYYDERGSAWPRYRIRGDDGKWAWNKDEASIIPYGLSRPIPLGMDGRMWIVEGESDCWAMWANGVSALGIPGASMAGTLKLEHLAGVACAYVVQEPGEAGSRFPARVAAKMRGEGYVGDIYAVTLPEKDPRALWLADKERFLERLEDAANAAILLEPYRAADPPPERTARRLSVSDLYALGGQRMEHLIEGLLPKRGIAILGARQKVGKSCIASHVAFSVARGTEALGRRCVQGRVLYLSFDESSEMLKDRFEVMGLRENDPIEFCVDQPPTDWVPWLRSWIDDFKPSLLVVDTISKLVRPESMDDYSKINKALAPLLAIRTQYPLAQLWLTHNTKPGIGTTAIQGSIAWTAAVDTTIIATWDKTTNVRSIETEQRIGESVADVVFDIDLDTNVISVSNDVYMAGQRHIEQTLLSYYKDDRAVTIESLVEYTGARKYLVRRAVDALLDAGLLFLEGSGKTGDPYRYRSIKLAP
jgi:hypothetical protein